MRTSSLWKPLLILFILSLAIRALTSLPQHHPRSMDEAYSYVNAVTLAQGGGFTEHFIWNYLNPPEGIPHPGNLYWMPLSSLIAWVGLKVGGISYSAAQIGFIVLAALLPPLGFLIAQQSSGQARYGWVVGLMLIWSGFYFDMWPSIDNFTPFALAGALCLYTTWRMVETDQLLWALLAGAMAGFGHLARADGPLLLMAIGLAAAGYGLWAGTDGSPAKRTLTVGRWLIAILIGYLIIMAPWFWRNIQVVGAPLAPGGSKTIWLQSYNDLFSYGKDLSWRSYLAWGWGPIVNSKLWALGLNLQRLLGEQGLIFALPLAMIGFWRLRAHRLFQIALLYTALLFIALTFVFTFPGPRGSWFHSAGAILPYMFTAAVAGLDTIIEWIARRRRTWQVKPAKMVFSGGLVFLSIFLTTLIYLPKLSQSAKPADPAYPEMVEWLTDQPATVMIGNPPAWLYYGGWQAIIVPNESIETILQVADRYGATYLALDQNLPQTLKPIFNQEVTHPRLQLEATFTGPTYLYRILP